MSKPFTILNVKAITDAYYNKQEISYSRMVELLNEIAIEWSKTNNNG